MKASVSYPSAASAGSLRLGGIAFLACACGALATVKMDIGGEIYAAEMALPLLALVARFASGGDRAIREPLFVFFLLAGFVSLGGYMLSDLAQGSRPDQFLRGWGRVGLVLSDFIAFAVLFGQDRRNFWWYALGAGLGSILLLRLVAHAPLGFWKFGYADPVVVASAALGVFLPLRLTSAWIGLLGIYSMWTDFRSFAATCLAIAGYLWIRAGRPERPMAGSGSMVKLVVAGGAIMAVILLALSVTGGSDSGRRNESDAGRRAAFETGVEAVTRSPVIGYGSWAENKEVTAMYLNRMNSLRGGSGSVATGNKVGFNPHSQILHSWYEAGVFGTAFLVTLLWQLFRQGRWLFLRRPVDALTPLLAYFALSTLWNLFMSPFSAPHRIGIAIGAAILVMMSIEQRRGANDAGSAPGSRPAKPGIAIAPAAPAVSDTRRAVRYGKRQLRLRRMNLR